MATPVVAVTPSPAARAGSAASARLYGYVRVRRDRCYEKAKRGRTGVFQAYRERSAVQARAYEAKILRWGR